MTKTPHPVYTNASAICLNPMPHRPLFTLFTAAIHIQSWTAHPGRTDSWGTFLLWVSHRLDAKSTSVSERIWRLSHHVYQTGEHWNKLDSQALVLQELGGLTADIGVAKSPCLRLYTSTRRISHIHSDHLRKLSALTRRFDTG